MNPLLLGAALLTASMLAPPRADTPAGAFERYREALLAKDGKAAAAVLDAESIAYYTRMRTLALDGAPAEVKKLPIIDRLSVLRVRHEVGRARLEPMDGAALLAYAVERGWISETSVRQLSLGKVVVRGDSASAEIKVGDKVAPPQYVWRFRREGGAWKFNLVTLLELGEAAVRETVRQSGGTEDEFVFAVLEKLSGKALTDEIWTPLRPSTAGGE
jgi:hypothetical protein